MKYKISREWTDEERKAVIRAHLIKIIEAPRLADNWEIKAHADSALSVIGYSADFLNAHRDTALEGIGFE